MHVTCACGKKSVYLIENIIKIDNKLFTKSLCAKYGLRFNVEPKKKCDHKMLLNVQSNEWISTGERKRKEKPNNKIIEMNGCFGCFMSNFLFCLVCFTKWKHLQLNRLFHLFFFQCLLHSMEIMFNLVNVNHSGWEVFDSKLEISNHWCQSKSLKYIIHTLMCCLLLLLPEKTCTWVNCFGIGIGNENHYRNEKKKKKKK